MSEFPKSTCPHVTPRSRIVHMSEFPKHHCMHVVVAFLLQCSCWNLGQPCHRQEEEEDGCHGGDHAGDDDCGGKIMESRFCYNFRSLENVSSCISDFGLEWQRPV